MATDYRWVRKAYCTAEAALAQCASEVKQDEVVQAALLQIKVAEAAIASRAAEIEASLEEDT